MKQLLIFFVMLAIALWIDLKPVVRDQLKTDTMTIQVTGAVKEEGSFELPLYSTIGDLLDLVQLQETADLSVLNPNTILKDADVINIPFQKEAGEENRISINHATLEELCTLNGIGESTARKIIDYRNENGLFQNLEDLMQVKGIGEARFARLKDSICL